MWKAIVCVTLMLGLIGCVAPSKSISSTPDRDKLFVRRNFFSSGNLEAEWTEKLLPDGRYVKHGRCVHWYPDGSKCSEGDFVEGDEHGPWQYWWRSGLLRQKGSYEMGLLHRRGEWLTWDEEGRLSCTSYHFNDGDSVVRALWPSGRKRWQYQYVNGKQDGTVWAWFHNGQRESVAQMVDGELHGDSYEWDETGKLLRHQVYVHGELIKEDNEEPK